MTAPVFQMRLALVSLLMLLLGACSTVVHVPARKGAGAALPGAANGEVNRTGVVSPGSVDDAVAGYARVLQRHVNDHGEVDFAALRDDASNAGLGALESYVQAIAVTPLDAAPTQQARLAHMINAYNALSMFNVVEAGIPQTHAGLNKVGFFIGRKLVVGQQPMSLYSFENEVIRPFTRKLGDPRVHFALNCLAVSCPVLPRQPFSAATLDAELERETRAFFARPQNWRVDHASASVWLNEILSFYTEDFVPVPATSLIEYANRYASTTAPAHYSVRFAPYDWTVANSRRVR